jgi:hypothetical protein
MQNRDSNAPSRAGADAERLALDRIPIRMRESGITSSAWCLKLRTAAGDGTIARIETPSGVTLFRGDGIFLGRPQPELAAEYARGLPPPESPEPDAGQFG